MNPELKKSKSSKKKKVELSTLEKLFPLIVTYNTIDNMDWFTGKTELQSNIAVDIAEILNESYSKFKK